MHNSHYTNLKLCIVDKLKKSFLRFPSSLETRDDDADNGEIRRGEREVDDRAKLHGEALRKCFKS